MKKSIIIYCMLFSLNAALACDVCGCAGSANYLGIVPLVSKNMWGYKFQYTSFSHPNTPENMNNGSLVKQDVYYSNNLWIRYYLNPKLQIYANLPFKINQRQETLRTTTISGVGDLNLAALYTIFKTKNEDAKWQQRFLGGVNLSMPTGKYMQRDETKKMLPAYFQIGTGAWSYGVNTNYTLRYKKIGANVTAQYLVNTENEIDYKLGNQIQASLVAFYWLDIKKATILPQVGVVFDQLNEDKDLGVIETSTGATRLSGILGADMYLGKFLVNATVMLPLAEKLPYAQPSIKPKFSFSLSYFFGK